MTRSLSILSLLLVLGLSACAGVGDAPEAATGDAVNVATAEGLTLPIDTARSEINWKAAKVTRAHDGGFHAFDGTVTVGSGTVTGVNLTIDLNSLWSDEERLTGHLKNEDFFDVPQYPTATFEASQFEAVDSAGATHLVTGNLTMHGVTRSVTFPATIGVSEQEVTAAADFIINRRNWEINYDGAANDLIENDVRILFDIVASTAPSASDATAAEAPAAE